MVVGELCVGCRVVFSTKWKRVAFHEAAWTRPDDHFDQLREGKITWYWVSFHGRSSGIEGRHKNWKAQKGALRGRRWPSLFYSVRTLGIWTAIFSTAGFWQMCYLAWCLRSVSLMFLTSFLLGVRRHHVASEEFEALLPSLRSSRIVSI